MDDLGMTHKTTEALQKLRNDIAARANGFRAHPAIFNGKIVSEELWFWVRQLDEVIGDQPHA